MRQTFILVIFRANCDTDGTGRGVSVVIPLIRVNQYCLGKNSKKNAKNVKNCYLKSRKSNELSNAINFVDLFALY